MAHAQHPDSTLSQNETGTLNHIFDVDSSEDDDFSLPEAHQAVDSHLAAAPRNSSDDLASLATDMLHGQDGGQDFARDAALYGGEFDTQFVRTSTLETLSHDDLMDSLQPGDDFHRSGVQYGDTVQQNSLQRRGTFPLNSLHRGDTGHMFTFERADTMQLSQQNPLQRGDTMQLSQQLDTEQLHHEEGTDVAHDNAQVYAWPIARSNTEQLTQHLLLDGEGLSHLRQLQNQGPSPSLGLQDHSPTMLPPGTVEAQSSSAAGSAFAVHAPLVTPNNNAQLGFNLPVPAPAMAYTPPGIAPASSRPVGPGKRGPEALEGSDDDDCTQPPPSPTRDETPQTSKKGMSLRQHVEFCEVVATDLGINSRQERDWNSLWTVFITNYVWGLVFFNDNRNVYKQKVKLVLHERRERGHLSYWKVLRACASSRDIAIHLLRDAGALPDGEWDFSVIAAFLYAQARDNEPGPGSILKWNQEAREDMIAKIMKLHQEHGETFFQISLRFRRLVVRSEIELALLSRCRCVECAKWNVSHSSDNAELLRLEWTRSRAAIVGALLAEHEISGGDANALEANIRNSDAFPLNVFKKWPKPDIVAFLSASHSEKSCSACQQARAKRRRRSSVGIPHAADLSDISFDFVEANALDVGDDPRGCYDYTDDESDCEHPEDCASPRAGANDAAAVLVAGLEQLSV